MNYNNNNAGFYPQKKNYQQQPFQMVQNPGTFQPTYKRSGAVYTKMKKGKFEGEICVNAWKVGKSGMLKASAFPVDGVVHVGKEKGHEFMRYAVDVTNVGNGTNQTYWCLMRLDTKVIVIKELGLCITPNGQGHTKSGKRVSGYFGKNYKSR